MALLAITVPLALLVVATLCDLRKREVPDWISLAILGWAVIAIALRLHNVGWMGGLIGLLIGFALTAVVFYLGGLGGADVKLVSATGAVVGPFALIFVLFWMALAGGVLAIIAAVRGKRDYAYVPAITLGFIAYLIYPGGLLRYAFSS